MVCLDTSFIVDLLRGNEEINEIKNQIDEEGLEITISSPTIMEITKGLEIGKVREGEKEKVAELISMLPILDFDKESAILAGKIEAELLRRGDVIDLEDIMIGGIAISNGEQLLTRNIKHFEKIKDLEIWDY